MDVSSKRYLSMDVLRVVATVMVVISHTWVPISNKYIQALLSNHVPLFVALGFFLYNDFGNKGHLDIKVILNFLKKRIIRLYVPFLFWMLFMVKLSYKTLTVKNIIVYLIGGVGLLYYIPMLIYTIIIITSIRTFSLFFNHSKFIFYIVSIFLTVSSGLLLRIYMHDIKIVMFDMPQIQWVVTMVITMFSYSLIGLFFREIYNIDRVPFKNERKSVKILVSILSLGIAILFSILNCKWLGFLGANDCGAYHGIGRLIGVAMIFYVAVLYIDNNDSVFSAMINKLSFVTPGVFFMHPLIWPVVMEYLSLERNGGKLTILTVIISFIFATLLSKVGKIGRMLAT